MPVGEAQSQISYVQGVLPPRPPAWLRACVRYPCRSYRWRKRFEKSLQASFDIRIYLLNPSCITQHLHLD